ncbi:hypothetical protein BV22DRAFT_338391 [Leucogyrophana mollusca]|uniref:Uncharacterized protein n=1 Tax=Leucogyrophana mollusca TaxID=85980 RepID=A0ACB8BN16_9AGAM|nr:hypothetical protein BV22DRAFT_338391 [Leucogyrophana mollusca]
MLDTVPFDILYAITSFLDVASIIRLQRVSRSLYQGTQDRSVWTTAYRDSILPRPKGPYNWQSTSYLKETLIRSAKLALQWPSACDRAKDTTPTASVPPQGSPALVSHHIEFASDVTRHDIIAGRWLLVWNEREVWCWDIEAQLSPHLRHSDSDFGPGSEPDSPGDMGKNSSTSPVLVYRCSDESEIVDLRSASFTNAYGCLQAFTVVEEQKIHLVAKHVINVFKMGFPGSCGDKHVLMTLVQVIPGRETGISSVALGPSMLIIELPSNRQPSEVRLVHTETFQVYVLVLGDIGPARFEFYQNLSLHVGSAHCLVTRPFVALAGEEDEDEDEDDAGNSVEMLHGYLVEAFPVPTAVPSSSSPLDSQCIEASHRGSCYVDKLFSGGILWEWRALAEQFDHLDDLHPLPSDILVNFALMGRSLRDSSPIFYIVHLSLAADSGLIFDNYYGFFANVGRAYDISEYDGVSLHCRLITLNESSGAVGRGLLSFKSHDNGRFNLRIRFQWRVTWGSGELSCNSLCR